MPLRAGTTRVMALSGLDFYSRVKGLEGKSEAERRRLVYKAIVRRGDAAWILPLISAILAATIWVGAGRQLLVLALVASNGSAAAAVAPGAGTGATSLPRPMWTLLVGLSTIVALFAFTTTRRILVVRTLKKLINRASCPFCEFCLMGLPVRGAVVRCPECGEAIDLYAHGLKPDDLTAPESKRRPFAGAGRFGAYRTPASSTSERRAKGKPPRTQ